MNSWLQSMLAHIGRWWRADNTSNGNKVIVAIVVFALAGIISVLLGTFSEVAPDEVRGASAVAKAAPTAPTFPTATATAVPTATADPTPRPERSAESEDLVGRLLERGCVRQPIVPASWPVTAAVGYNDSDCPFFEGTIRGPGEKHDYIITLGENDLLSINSWEGPEDRTNYSSEITAYLIDPRGDEKEREPLVNDPNFVYGAPPAGDYILRFRVDNDDTIGHYRVEIYTVTTPERSAESEDLAGRLLERGCVRQPIVPASWPVTAAVGYNDSDCPFFEGTIRGPGEKHDYIITLGENDLLSINSWEGPEDRTNYSSEITAYLIDPRGDEKEREPLVNDPNFVYGAPPAGDYILRFRVDNDDTIGHYRVEIYTVTTPERSAESEDLAGRLLERGCVRQPIVPASWPVTAAVGYNDSDCPFFEGTIRGPGEKHDYIITLGENDLLSINSWEGPEDRTNYSSEITAYLIDPRGDEKEREPLVNDPNFVYGAPPAGDYILRFRVDNDDTIGHYRVEIYTVTTPERSAESEDLAGRLLERGCVRQPIVPASWPVTAAVGYNDSDCPFFEGTIRGPGEKHDYIITLGENDLLSINSWEGPEDRTNYSSEITAYLIDPRGDEKEREPLVNDPNFVYGAPPAGDYILRFRVDNDDTIGHYRVEIYTVTTPERSAESEDLAGRLLERGCVRQPIVPASWPVTAAVGYNDSDCPFFEGTIRGPGEKHDYIITLGENDLLSINSWEGPEDRTNYSSEITAYLIDPRGDEKEREPLVNDPNFVYGAPPAGDYILRFRVDNDDTIGHYRVEIYTVTN